jgi:hypothetical protein
MLSFDYSDEPRYKIKCIGDYWIKVYIKDVCTIPFIDPAPTTSRPVTEGFFAYIFIDL